MIRYFVIAGSPRGGTNFFCSLLANNGLGAPQEDFDGMNITAPFSHAIASGQSTEEYAEEISKDATRSPFATKLFWQFLEPMLANSKVCYLDAYQLLRNLYPDAKYIFISRRDKVAQAISRARAQDTNKWFLLANDTNLKAKSDQMTTLIAPQRIHRILLDIISDEMQWRRLFMRASITPLEINYETLCTNTEETIVKIGNFLIGKDFRFKTAVSPLVIQRDMQTSLIREEYFKQVGMKNAAKWTPSSEK